MDLTYATMFDTNWWNRLRYTLYAPGYDLVGGWFGPLRRRSIDALSLQDGERLLIVGAGTGLDLMWCPPGVHVLATDLTAAMLARARRHARPRLHLAVMDGHQLALADESVDVVVLHLILAVIPDPVACLREVDRVLRRGGRVAVLDKFLQEGRTPSLFRRGVNAVVRVVATDINRRLSDLLRESRTGLRIASDEPAMLGGLFRIVRLEKR
jgi:ubiquinone/menaquinone biosynthesis C-methylase UbiE